MPGAYSGAFAEIHVRREGITIDLGGMRPEQVTDLRVCAGKKTDLSLLADYPNVTQLFLRGNFTSLDAVRGLVRLRRLTLYPSTVLDCAPLAGLSLEALTVCDRMVEHIDALFSPALRLLELGEMRRLDDLSFLEKAAGLRKLYLHGLPAAEALPDFSKLPELYALKLYELHKLHDLEGLARSNIRYLSASLIADKVPGTRLAEVLTAMPGLEQADLTRIDRGSPRRFTVLRNQLRRAGREHLLVEGMDYRAWERL